MKTAALTLIALQWLIVANLHAASGKPYEPECVDTPVNWNISRTECEYDKKPFITGVPIPTSYMVPQTGKLKLEVLLHGDTTWPVFCINDGFSKESALVIKPCAGHYPNRNNHEWAFGWWAGFDGELSNVLRVAHNIEYAKSRWADRLESQTVKIGGRSYGGTGSILHSTLIPHMIDIVDADLAHTNFVEPGVGHYFENPAVSNTWGDIDPSLLDISKTMASGRADHIYYRVRSSTQDHLGRFNPKFVEDCDTYKIACYVTWDEGRHDYEINHNQNLYTCPHMEWRSDSSKIVFTNSSANVFESRGHYNEGLCWWKLEQYYRDEPDRFLIALKYQPRLINKLPAMPDAVSFDVTIRDYKLEGTHFEYRFGDQRGEAVAVDGEITIKGLALDSNRGFRGLEIVPKQDWELVYVESNRTIGKRDYSLWDHGIGVGRIDGGFPESDIAIEKKDGTQKVIHNCTDSDKICATDDPRVSPDGKKIFYWEGTGDYLQDVWTIGITPKEKTGAKDIHKLTECRLWVYELETGEGYPISQGHCDRTPEWLDNDTVVFASNRAKEYVPLTCAAKINPVQGMAYKLGYQLYRGDIVNKQLTNIERLTPHHPNIMSPEYTSSGRLLASAHNAGERTCFNTSPKNAWYVINMDANGGDQTSAEFAFHGYPVMKTYEFVPTIDPRRRGILASPKAFRVVTEIEKGLFCGNEYYRNNHGGSNGILHCWRENNNEGVLKGNQLASAEQFGAFSLDGSGQFVPSSHYVATPFAESQDALVRFDMQGRAFGKVGASFAHTDGKYGFVWNRGMGYTHAIDVSGIDYTDSKNLGGEPPAHRVIALAKVPVVTNPFDSEQIEILSSRPDKHRYAPAQIRPYRDHFGQDLPAQIPRLAAGKAILKSENVHEHQIFPIPGKTSKAEREAIQGNLEEGTITKACIDYIKPFKSQPQAFGLDVLKTECTDVAEDGSTEQEVIPDLPFQMFWLDAAGKELARDHSLHSLRSGETRCCAGCHLHSEDSAPCGTE